MSKHMLGGIILGVLAVLRFVSPVSAEEKLISYQAMNLELALKVAQETLKACQDDGFQVAVVVVDRAGIVQALLRDRLAGIYTPDIAILALQLHFYM